MPPPPIDQPASGESDDMETESTELVIVRDVKVETPQANMAIPLFFTGVALGSVLPFLL